MGEMVKAEHPATPEKLAGPPECHASGCSTSSLAGCRFCPAHEAMREEMTLFVGGTPGELPEWARGLLPLRLHHSPPLDWLYKNRVYN